MAIVKGTDHGFKVYFLVCVALSLQTSSSSNESDEAYVRLNNITLPLKSFLREYCNKEPCLDYQWCNESFPGFYCGKTTNGKQTCHQWCIGDDTTCSDVEECCGNEFECIHQICRSANMRIDFVIIAKVALATALIVTVFAVFTLCWKGLVEPRCTSYNSHLSDDSISVASSERYRTDAGNNSCVSRDVEREKPPPYDECVQQSCTACSSQEEPPPYSIAVNISQVAVDSLPDPPARYFLACSSEMSQLTLENIKLQEVPFESIREIIISSPVTNMEDFVCFSTPETSTTSTDVESNTPENEEAKPECGPLSPEETVATANGETEKPNDTGV